MRNTVRHSSLNNDYETQGKQQSRVSRREMWLGKQTWRHLKALTKVNIWRILATAVFRQKKSEKDLMNEEK